jgi:hypothetical protein
MAQNTFYGLRRAIQSSANPGKTTSKTFANLCHRNILTASRRTRKTIFNYPGTDCRKFSNSAATVIPVVCATEQRPLPCRDGDVWSHPARRHPSRIVPTGESCCVQFRDSVQSGPALMLQQENFRGIPPAHDEPCCVVEGESIGRSPGGNTCGTFTLTTCRARPRSLKATDSLANPVPIPGRGRRWACARAEETQRFGGYARGDAPSPQSGFANNCFSPWVALTTGSPCKSSSATASAGLQSTAGCVHFVSHLI